jgi:hypothetical protein
MWRKLTIVCSLFLVAALLLAACGENSPYQSGSSKAGATGHLNSFARPEWIHIEANFGFEKSLATTIFGKETGKIDFSYYITGDTSGTIRSFYTTTFADRLLNFQKSPFATLGGIALPVGTLTTYNFDLPDDAPRPNRAEDIDLAVIDSGPATELFLKRLRLNVPIVGKQMRLEQHFLVVLTN